jgi:hypothetical protein
VQAEFDIQEAYYFARRAQAVYDEKPTIYDPVTDTAVMIRETAKRIEIGFPGTRNFRDVMKDLEVLRSARLIGGVVCGVHHGFDLAWNGVRDAVMDSLSRMEAGKPVAGFGHSKAGAVATRCLPDISKLTGRPIDSCYTFGEPRGGDANYALMCDVLFGDRHWRVEDGDDAICRLPGWFAGNRHSGHCVLLNANRPQYKIDPNLWFKITSDALEVWKAKFTGNVMVLAEDHHVDKYVERFRRLTIN